MFKSRFRPLAKPHTRSPYFTRITHPPPHNTETWGVWIDDNQHPHGKLLLTISEHAGDLSTQATLADWIAGRLNDWDLARRKHIDTYHPPHPKIKPLRLRSLNAELEKQAHQRQK